VIRAGRGAHRRAESHACGGRCLRVEPAGGGDPLPSRGAQRRCAVRLPLGRGAQARAARTRGAGVNARLATTGDAGVDVAVAARVDALDWARIGGELDANGCAPVPGLLARDACEALAAQYDDGLFRKRVVMARHGYGRGEYRYFRYPLPGAVQALRAAFYPHLAPVANRWNAAMRLDIAYPPRHEDF